MVEAMALPCSMVCCTLVLRTRYCSMLTIISATTIATMNLKRRPAEARGDERIGDDIKDRRECIRGAMWRGLSTPRSAAGRRAGRHIGAIIAAMPLIRCPKCAQAYDIPGVIAVRLPNSIATCHCGEWISGSKAAVLARLLNPDQIKEIDLKPYRVEAPSAGAAPAPAEAEPEPAAAPRSVRIVARGARESVNTVFTIKDHPL